MTPVHVPGKTSASLACKRTRGQCGRGARRCSAASRVWHGITPGSPRERGARTLGLQCDVQTGRVHSTQQHPKASDCAAVCGKVSCVNSNALAHDGQYAPISTGGVRCGWYMQENMSGARQVRQPLEPCDSNSNQTTHQHVLGDLAILHGRSCCLDGHDSAHHLLNSGQLVRR